jgi:hypothetical protein
MSSAPPDAAAAAVPGLRRPFIRAVEVWLPGTDRTLLEFGGGLYGRARRFGAASTGLCFGRGEGLPGAAWEAGAPVMLKQFEGANFRRTTAARADGLSCGIAVPVLAGEVLTAVLAIFCGDDADHAGAIEVWYNAGGASPDLTLADGYYGTTGEAFEYLSRRTSFRKGHGLPGLVWDTGLPVFLDDLGRGNRFLRADSARQVGINRGFALPCATVGRGTTVLAFLSALGTPIARRFETWRPDAAGEALHRHGGFCETDGALGAGAREDALSRGQGALGRAWLHGIPVITDAATTEPGATGHAARAAGSTELVALPVLRDGRTVAVVAWFL